MPGYKRTSKSGAGAKPPPSRIHQPAHRGIPQNCGKHGLNDKLGSGGYCTESRNFASRITSDTVSMTNFANRRSSQ